MKIKKILIAVLISTVIVIAARAGIAVYKTQDIPTEEIKVQLVADYALFGLIPTTYNLRVDEIDGDLNDYYVVIVSNLADSNDTIVLHIHSPGGRVSVMIDMINALSNTKAYTISINEGIAASAAADIAMATDEVRATPASAFLFHRARSSGNLLSPIHPIEILMNAYAEKYIFPYLTPEQVNQYAIGDDVTIPGESFAKQVQDLRHSTDKRV